MFLREENDTPEKSGSGKPVGEKSKRKDIVAECTRERVDSVFI